MYFDKEGNFKRSSPQASAGLAAGRRDTVAMDRSDAGEPDPVRLLEGQAALRRVAALVARRELLTGEHVVPWMFEELGGLAPLRDAAHLLAEHDWPRLYDLDRLAANEVPAAAAVYAEDLYVERRFSEQTAAHVRGLRPWLTNEYEHNGLRADGARILGRLIDLARGRA